MPITPRPVSSSHVELVTLQRSLSTAVSERAIETVRLDVEEEKVKQATARAEEIERQKARAEELQQKKEDLAAKERRLKTGIPEELIPVRDIFVRKLLKEINEYRSIIQDKPRRMDGVVKALRFMAAAGHCIPSKVGPGGVSIDFTGAVTDATDTGIEAREMGKRARALDVMASLSNTPDADLTKFERNIRMAVTGIVIDFAHQLRCLDEENRTRFGIGAAEKTLDGLTRIVTHDGTLEHNVREAFLLGKTNTRLRANHHPSGHDKWNIKSMIEESYVKTPDGEIYASKDCRPRKYGERDGAPHELAAIGFIKYSSLGAAGLAALTRSSGMGRSM